MTYLEPLKIPVFLIDVFSWFPTTFYIKIWFIIQLKQPFINGWPWGSRYLPTVDGRNPAPVDMENLPVFTRFYTCPGGAGFLPSTVVTSSSQDLRVTKKSSFIILLPSTDSAIEPLPAPPGNVEKHGMDGNVGNQLFSPSCFLRVQIYIYIRRLYRCFWISLGTRMTWVT